MSLLLDCPPSAPRWMQLVALLVFCLSVGNANPLSTLWTPSCSLETPQSFLKDSELAQSDRELLFGSLKGLNCLKGQPKGRIFVFGARGGNDKFNGDEHRKDTIPICNSLVALGWQAIPVFYSDQAYDLILRLASQLNVEGFISRVNPDQYPGVTNSKYDNLLLELFRRGLVAMPHPTLMKQLGAKDALAKISKLRTGLPDTRAHYDIESFRRDFPVSLAQGPRVVKQNRGSQGAGVWICHLKNETMYKSVESIPLSAELVLTEAVDNHVETKTLGQFMTFAERYLTRDESEAGLIIDQAFLPRISEGEVRVLFIGQQPVELVHKKPRRGGFSATLNSGATYTKHQPDDPRFAHLMNQFVRRDVPNLLKELGLNEHSLPLLWTIDFIVGDPQHRFGSAAVPAWTKGRDYYFVGEINCSCVGITTQLHLTDRVAAEAVRLVEDKRRERAEAEQALRLARGLAARGRVPRLLRRVSPPQLSSSRVSRLFTKVLA